MSRERLNEAQELFCLLYTDLNNPVTYSNATQSYIQSHPNCKSEKAAGVEGFKCLEKPKIKKRIEEIKTKQSKELGFDRNDVLRELKSIGFSKATDYVDIIAGKVCIKDTSKMAPDAIKAISSIEQGAYGVKLRTHSKDKALTTLLNHFDNVEEPKETEHTPYYLPITHITSDYVECYRAVHQALENGKYREFINYGGRGSIKSSFWTAIAVEIIKNDSQAHCVFTRRYKTDLKDSVFAQFKKTCIRLGVVDEFDFKESPCRAIYKSTGQTVMFVGCDKPVSLKSYGVTFGYVKMICSDEADEMAGIEQLDSVEDTFLRSDCHAISVKLYNPPKSINNWMNKYTEEKRSDPATFICHSFYYNVPIEWLGQRFFDRAEWFKVHKPKYYQNNYLGEVTGTGGQIFENIEYRTISDEEINSFDYFCYGLDYGFEHPQAFIQCYYDRETETLYPIYELRTVRMKQTNFAKRLIKHYKDIGVNIKQKEIKADSARPDLIHDWQDFGFDLFGATKNWKGGGRDYSWEWLQERAKIVIDRERTPYLAKEMETAEHKILRDGSFSSEYPTLNEDCIMAMIYALNYEIRNEKSLGDYQDAEDDEYE